MTRKSKFALIGAGTAVVAILFFARGCERLVERTVSFPAPLGNVDFENFSVLAPLTTPIQEIRIQVEQIPDIAQLLDLRVFGEFQPEMTDAELAARFGKPQRTYTDDFGSTWSEYSTPLGYVRIGYDRRTSSAGQDENRAEGRRALQAYTDRPPDQVFRAPLLSVVRTAEQMARRADYRQFHVFDSKKDLVLEFWVRNDRIDHIELFKHVDR